MFVVLSQCNLVKHFGNCKFDMNVGETYPLLELQLRIISRCHYQQSLLC